MFTLFFFIFVPRFLIIPVAEDFAVEKLIVAQSVQ